jgi:hypothetical protein
MIEFPDGLVVPVESISRCHRLILMVNVATNR